MEQPDATIISNEDSAIIVPEQLISPHRLVTAAQRVLRKSARSTPPSSHWDTPKLPRSPLDIQVSKDLLDRALRIADTILKVAGSRGLKLVAPQDQTAYFEIDSIVVRWVLDEPRRRVPYKRDPNVKESVWDSFHSDTMLVYSGQLRLTLTTDNCQRLRQDGPRIGPLEKQISSIIDAFPALAEREKQRRIELEEEHKRWEIERERRHKEWLEKEAIRKAKEEEERKLQQRIEHLNQSMEDWIHYRELCRYLQAVETEATERGEAIDPETPLGAWLQWAWQYVNSLDPLPLALRNTL